MKYTTQELHELREHVYHNHSLRRLDANVCALVRRYGLNKKRKRGKKGGIKTRETSVRSVNPNNLIEIVPTQSPNENDEDFQFLLLNAQSLKGKEFILRRELDKVEAEFAIITETWLGEEDTN